jgi:hypothetical protein
LIKKWTLEKTAIEIFLFYQRVRKIVYILNIAYQVKKINPVFGKEFIE